MTDKTAYLNELLAAEAQQAKNELERIQHEIAIDSAKKQAELDLKLSKERVELALETEKKLQNLKIENEQDLQNLKSLQVKYNEVLSLAPNLQSQIYEIVGLWDKTVSYKEILTTYRVALSSIEKWWDGFNSSELSSNPEYAAAAKRKFLAIKISSYSENIEAIEQLLANKLRVETEGRREKEALKKIHLREDLYSKALNDFQVVFMKYKNHLEGIQKRDINRVFFKWDWFLKGFEGIWEEAVGEGLWVLIGLALKLGASVAWFVAFFIVVIPINIILRIFLNDFEKLKKEIIPRFQIWQAYVENIPGSITFQNMDSVNAALTARKVTALLIIEDIELNFLTLGFGKYEENKILDKYYSEFCAVIGALKNAL